MVAAKDAAIATAAKAADRRAAAAVAADAAAEEARAATTEQGVALAAVEYAAATDRARLIGERDDAAASVQLLEHQVSEREKQLVALEAEHVALEEDMESKAGERMAQLQTELARVLEDNSAWLLELKESRVALQTALAAAADSSLVAQASIT